MSQTDEKIEKFEEMVESPDGNNIDKYPMNRIWRNKLMQNGCLEVTDSDGLVGYILTPDYAKALSNRIKKLEEKLQ